MKPSSRRVARFAVLGLTGAVLSCGLVFAVPGLAFAHGLHGVVAAPSGDDLVLGRRTGFRPPFLLPGHRSHDPNVIGHGWWMNIDLGPDIGKAAACRTLSAGPKIITIDNKPAPRAKVRVIYGLDPCGI